MLILKMAWRNVWRNARRSTITIAAMTLAIGLIPFDPGEGRLGNRRCAKTEMDERLAQLLRAHADGRVMQKTLSLLPARSRK